VFRRHFLLKFTRQAQTNLEKTEMLEQLRALENGAKIKVIEVSETSVGVDTADDFQRVREILEKHI
jgi:3-deoxy-manno-octulosonate cytidylyltransferase (CMP-KDO synthetase)